MRDVQVWSVSGSGMESLLGKEQHIERMESRRIEAQFKNIETYIKYQERMWEAETELQSQG